MSEDTKGFMNYLTPTVSVIVSTFNQPEFLRLVLLALAEQDAKNFEVIVADDGSEEITKKVIESIKPLVKYNISHVWQPHNNFRAAMIRNKSMAVATGDYLIFLDGDSIPRVSFISTHQKLAEHNYFVAGNRVLLSSEFTEEILRQGFGVQKWTFWHWLRVFCRGGINRLLPVLSLGRLYWRYLCRTRWQGAKTCNLGVWKKDFFVVNGFDESYCGWGYEDSDLVVRLIRSGVLRKDGRFALPVFHLWHPTNSHYREQENYKKLEKVIASSYTRAPTGVDKYVNLSKL